MYNHVHAYKNKTIYVESRQFQIDSCLYYYNYNVYTTFFNTYLCLKMIRFMFLPTISPIFSVFPKVNSLPESRAGRCKRSWMSGKMSGINEGQMGMGYTYIYIYIYVVYTVYIGDILSENGLLPHVWPMSSKLIWKMNEHYDFDQWTEWGTLRICFQTKPFTHWVIPT